MSTVIVGSDSKEGMMLGGSESGALLMLDNGFLDEQILPYSPSISSADIYGTPNWVRSIATLYR